MIAGTHTMRNMYLIHGQGEVNYNRPEYGATPQPWEENGSQLMQEQEPGGFFSSLTDIDPVWLMTGAAVAIVGIIILSGRKKRR